MNGTDFYAVFGQPVKHSKSPRIHRLFAEQTNQNLLYTAQEVSPDTFFLVTGTFFSKGGKGLNCTVPLKELAYRYAGHLTERAKLAGAVNTLAMQADGLVIGHNTDGTGLVTDLTMNHGIELTNRRILILGAGGASRGIIAPLLEHNPKELVIANRTISKAENIVQNFAKLGKLKCCGYADLSRYKFDLVLNATSASLNNQLPHLPEHLLSPSANCYDLSYGDLPTPFVAWGMKHGAVKSLDGLGMLVEQAADAFYIWRGIRPQTSGIIDLLNSERQAKQRVDTINL